MSSTPYRNRGKPIPKLEEKKEDENESLFAKTMRIHDETMKCHQETDIYLKNTKREILLKVLLKIKENPPKFLTEDSSNSKMSELDQTINELSNILKSNKK
ncbi:hypothetical protein M9Y10_044263 [Tritrichomonas musculus]|uniref:Uncharacterized protein n=1 Tax=Tritrichomonas musculus TaxID=1915356 RepID=A0ABR2K1Z2_9EUKA